MEGGTRMTHLLQEAEERLLTELRTLHRAQRKSRKDAYKLTLGQRIADDVAATMGSWTFIIIQSALLFIWIVLNITAYVQQWDPYPFILLNLFLSMLASVQAPVIMMSQNRQDTKDRLRGELDYEVNRRAESEIQGLSRKLNLLGEKMNDIEDLLRQPR